MRTFLFRSKKNENEEPDPVSHLDPEERYAGNHLFPGIISGFFIFVCFFLSLMTG